MNAFAGNVFIAIDCLQPSFFSSFYSIVERVDRIARELDPRVLRARFARFYFRMRK